MKLDALTWRLREAADDLERMRREATAAEQTLQDAQLAALLEEEGPGDPAAISLQSAATQSQLADEESLVELLRKRRSETHQEYCRARRKELILRLQERWGQGSGVGTAEAGSA